ncbi:S8 family serine peptidase [Solirubrobacter ginsenosidimutans]|uniref:S8 family serine peptidase n=1 Tax=Solirubrobacter ginsenosidimutans TaxID=490573 RepID=A0A9X3N789_9ACTN|nr:S8 family serine peptidase [Solirubrobacter ginsenosidimutans]MDA0166163.1 S8 family serine peptidase [Solirubrobacter ginsenosidimutans]
MTRLLRLAIATLAALSLTDAATPAQARAAVQHATSGARIDAIVVLHRQAVLPEAGARRASVLRALRSVAGADQRRLLALLAIRKLQGRVDRVEPFWIFNAVHVIADPDVVTELAALPEVAEIRPNTTLEAPAAPLSGGTPEWNITRVGAPALWSLGYRGQGVVVANMDTGVDATHPEIGSRWRGGTNSWFDPNGEHPATPTDVNGHGTWTMGTMAGAAVGVAPDARWIAVKVFNDHGTATTAGIHAGFQWLLDPDGNPATDDAPDVVNDSWTMSAPGCDLAFAPDLHSLRAAGVLPVFAAGNGGPAAGTSLSPADNPEAFAVGGTDAADGLDPGSSRGPSACDHSIYPQVVAPGVDVRTTDLYGLYATVSGTSIAAPHAAGALALLLSAFPGLDADRQALALRNGAVDLGPAGADNDSGAGRLDASGAYAWLLAAPDFSLQAAPASVTTPAGGSASYTIDVLARNGFTGAVSLSLTGLSASQASWTFTPGTEGSTQLTVTTAASLAPGTYPLTITGTSGTSTRSTKVALVAPEPPGYSLAATPSSQRTAAGGTVSYTVSTAAVGGFGSDVDLSLSGLTAAQGSWSFVPSATIAGGSGAVQLNVTTAASLAPGVYPLTLTAAGGGITHTAVLSLIVPDFSLAATPSSRSAAPGATVGYIVSVGAKNGFAGSVALSLSGLTAAQASWTFTPASIVGSGTSQLTLTTVSALAPGTYPLTITGVSGALRHTAAVTLVVTAPPDFGLTATPATATVVAGQNVTYTAAVSSIGGFAGNVSLSVAGLPSGATASFATNPLRAPGTSALTVRTTRTATRGTFTLTVTGTGGSLVHRATVTLVVRS